MPNELFDSADPQEQQQSPEPNQQPSLFHVGEGKKYKSLEELDKAYGHANEHIAQLEKELEQFREAQDAKTGNDEMLQKILDQLKPAKQPDQTAEPQDRVEDVVAKLLEQRERETVQKTNQQQVREALKAKFGDKAGEVYKEKAKELGVDLDALTAQSAKAVLQLFGASKAPEQGVPRTGVNTASLTHNEEDPHRQAYKDGKITREELFRRQWREALKKT